MDKITRKNLDNLWSQGRQLQNQAFSYILEATDVQKRQWFLLLALAVPILFNSVA